MLTVLALGAVLGIGLFVRSRSGGTFGAGAPSASASERVVPVPVITVTARDLPVVLDALGSVAAYNTVTVKSQVDGRIDKIFFTEGGSVKAGELLVQIDPRPFAIQAQLAAAALMRDKAVLTNAKLVLARNENLLKQGVGSQQAVDDARAEVAKNEGVVAGDAATAANAQLQLDFARIKSPIDGVTGVKLVDVGNVVHPSDPGGIVVITQLDPIVVLFTLPEDDLPRISLAMATRKLSVDAYSRDGSQLLAKGELLLVDNKIDPTTATIRLKAVFANEKRVLWPNQFIKARLALSVKKGAIAVPATVVQRGPQGPYAYVVDEGEKVRLVPVEVGDEPGRPRRRDQGALRR
ncbi:MAG: efflux RND transporter periplasmic adaptor subunit [Myxococcales bacterium]|nr:efflux RND transporter periplasmic adaptor subunit [Myxococcales bacterium]